MKKTVVLDVDDVLYGLNEAVEKLVVEKYPDFSFSKVHTYNFNKSLSDEEKSVAGICNTDAWDGLGAPREYIMSLYGLVKPFRESKLYDIPRLAELFIKCNVVLHTSGLSVDVCKFKLGQLNNLLDNLGVVGDVSVQLVGSMIHISVGGEKQGVVDRHFVSKPVVVCDYVVEDCLENLRGYSNCKMFLVDKPWNNPIYNSSCFDVMSKAVRVSDINKAIDIILDEVD